MSNYQYTPNQDFSPESFGQPMYEQPRRGGGGRAFLFSCGGLTLIGLLICCCCAGGVYYLMRQPIMVAFMWGTAGASDWNLAQDMVCEGSQADELTTDYINAGARLEAFTSNTSDFGATSLNATGTIVVDGQREPWAATLNMVKSDGGFLPYCVNEIVVTDGELPTSGS